MAKTLVLSNLWYPWPGASMMLSIVFRREEPETIVLNGDTTYCRRDQECPHVLDALETIRAAAPWADIVYIPGDIDVHAPKCIKQNPVFRREVTVAETYIVESIEAKYYITHGHQAREDELRRKLKLGPWDWLVLGHSGRLEENPLTRIIHVGGLGLYTPPALQGYLIIEDKGHKLKKL